MRRKVSNKQYAVALYEAVKGLKGEKLRQALKRFVAALAQKHKLKKTEKIIAEFVKYSKKQRGVVEIEIKSARKLHGETIEKIKKIFGKKVEEKESTDADLLGGVVVKTEDKIFDGSIKKQLQKLRQSLITNY